jgi:hypothetical protein
MAANRPAPTKTRSGGYESPDDEHQFFGPPQRLKSSPAAIPQRRHHATASLLERGEPSSSHASLNHLTLKAKNMRGKVGIRDRIACFQWTWFTMTMACHPIPLHMCYRGD